MDKYQRKKKRFMKTKRVFDHDKIASIDEATEKRTDLVASLLGSSKEARQIRNKFRKMVEVPQEDFDLQNYKYLGAELRNTVIKPAQVLRNQLKINPRHAKRLTSIEDFVTILPTSAESGAVNLEDDLMDAYRTSQDDLTQKESSTNVN